MKEKGDKLEVQTVACKCEFAVFSLLVITSLFAARTVLGSAYKTVSIFCFPVFMLYNAFISQKAVKASCLLFFFFPLMLNASNIKYAQIITKLLLISGKTPTD